MNQVHPPDESGAAAGAAETGDGGGVVARGTVIGFALVALLRPVAVRHRQPRGGLVRAE